MFPSLAAWETCVAETNLAARKQKMFLPEVKNIFVSRTQILRPKHMFPSLATVKTMLISFQCRSLIKKCFLATPSVLTTIKMVDCEEIEAGHAQTKGSAMYEMAVLLTRNWNSRERNASPVVRNRKVRASLSKGDIGDRILVFFLTILGLITSTRR